MKKSIVAIAMVATLSLMSCTNSADYKAKGEQMAKQLDELCEKQDSAAVLAFEDSIRLIEKEVVATGDSAAIADFRAALKESRQRNAPYITSVKVKNGMKNEDAIKDVVNDALEGNVNIQAVTESIDKLLLDQKDH